MKGVFFAGRVRPYPPFDGPPRVRLLGAFVSYGDFVLEYVLTGLLTGAVFHVSTWILCYGVRLLGDALGGGR